MAIAAPRALLATGRDFSRAIASDTVHTTAIAPDVSSNQGRGGAALMLADSYMRQAQQLQRDDVSPDLEPIDPDVNDGDPSGDMEPMDATIDEPDEGVAAIPDEPAEVIPTVSESLQRVIVSGDETEVTITAEEGETITAVIEDDSGDVQVEVEDTTDVLLSLRS
jgi:hypothetical protein